MKSLLRLGSLVVSFCALANAPAHAYWVHIHGNLTNAMMTQSGLGGSPAMSFIHAGALWPDISGCTPPDFCYCPYASANQDCTSSPLELGAGHFDNCQLQLGMDRVNELMSAAGAVHSFSIPVAAPYWPGLYGAFFSFGQALHAIQDFYAHSTWFECYSGLVRITGFWGDIPLWQGEDLDCEVTINGHSVAGLQTGTFATGGVAGCDVSHDELNKDNPFSDEGKKELRRVFGSFIGTYYMITSGAISRYDPVPSVFDANAAAARHTLYAYQVLRSGGCVYPFDCPSPPASDAQRTLRTMADHFDSLVTWMSSEPGLVLLASQVDSLMALWVDGDSAAVASFPYGEFDDSGFPTDPHYSGVGEAPGFERATVLAVQPNPSAGSVWLTVRVPVDGDAEVEVFDLGGARVTALRTTTTNRVGRVSWNGRAANGSQAPNGVYLARLRSAGHRGPAASARVVILR